MEIFDIVDENGMPTGETIERNEAHRKGICHRTGTSASCFYKKDQRTKTVSRDVMIPLRQGIFMQAMNQSHLHCVSSMRS